MGRCIAIKSINPLNEDAFILFTIGMCYYIKKRTWFSKDNMTHRISLDEAKIKLVELVHQAIQGEHIIITENNHPVVKLTPCQKKPKRRLGTAKGQVVIKEDFKEIPEDFKAYVP